MTRCTFITILLVFLGSTVLAQRVQIDAPESLRLYPAGSPTTRPSDRPERDDGTGRFYVVSDPILYIWKADPAVATGAAVIVCPGGGYDHVTMEPEGQRIAKWLNPMGITVFGLKYRTMPPSTDVGADALADGKRAMRLVRTHAAVWKIDPTKVGMLGYSAGANLILNLASHFDGGDAQAGDPIERQGSRPDFVVLLSTWPNRQTLAAYPLKSDSPPTFIAIAKDDRTAPPRFTNEIKARLEELKVPVQLYEVDRGGHGAFVIDGRGADAGWKEPVVQWLKGRGAIGR